MPDAHSAASLPLSPAGFTALVRQYEGALYGFLCGLVGNTEQAHDLTQDVFQDAWRATQRGDTPFTQHAPQDVLRRWLFQAAYHRAISVLRRRRRIHWESLEECHERDPEAFAAPVRFEDDVAEREALQTALARLGPQDAACLLLRIVHGFSAAETGEIVGASPQSIDTRLSRAKRRLRAVYAQETLPQASSRKGARS